MITLLVVGFALIWAIALYDHKPRPCSMCGQLLPGRQIVKHYQTWHQPTTKETTP